MVKRKAEAVESGPCSICMDDTILGKCPHEKPICRDCIGNWLNLDETRLIREKELTCYCKGGVINVDHIYNMVMVSSPEGINQVKSLSKLEVRFAEKEILNRAPTDEDEYRFFIRQFAIDIEGLRVSCPRCQRPFDGWTSCLAIRCECDDGVGAHICGWCLKWSAADVHGHVASCKVLKKTGGLMVVEKKKDDIMRRHLADLIVSKLLSLPHNHIVYAFNYLIDYLDKAEITGEVKAALRQHGVPLLLLHLVTWGSDSFVKYEDAEIRSLTSIALYHRAPTLLWFEDRRTKPPTLTHAIYQPHLHPGAQGFQMTVERRPTTYSLRHTWPAAATGAGAAAVAAGAGGGGERRLALVDTADRSLDKPSELRAVELSGEETARCLLMLDAGIPYVHLYHQSGRPATPADRVYETHAERAQASFLVIYPNRRVWALKPLCTAEGEVRIRPTQEERRASSHYDRAPVTF